MPARSHRRRIVVSPEWPLSPIHGFTFGSLVSCSGSRLLVQLFSLFAILVSFVVLQWMVQINTISTLA